MQSTRPRGMATWILAASVALILVATLLPTDDIEVNRFFCLFCADQSVSGFLLNVLLFVPLGAVMAWRGHSLARCTAVGAVLSTCVEMAQFVVPGRESALVDVLANTAG